MTRPASRGGAWPASVVNERSGVPALAALAHPDRVDWIVLDSVVPHDADRDLAAVVRRDLDGPKLLDVLTVMSIVDPTLPAGSGRVPAVSTLLLAGGHDLSTLLEWTRREAALAPGCRVVMVAGAGHDVQIRAAGDRGRKAIQAFLD